MEKREKSSGIVTRPLIAAENDSTPFWPVIYNEYTAVELSKGKLSNIPPSRDGIDRSIGRSRRLSSWLVDGRTLIRCSCSNAIRPVSIVYLLEKLLLEKIKIIKYKTIIRERKRSNSHRIRWTISHMQQRRKEKSNLNSALFPRIVKSSSRGQINTADKFHHNVTVSLPCSLKLAHVWAAGYREPILIQSMAASMSLQRRRRVEGAVTNSF